MRAYRLQKSNLLPVLEDLPTPAEGPGAVRIRTTAVSIHPVDLETCSGKNKVMLPMKRPFVPGVDFTGVITSVGEDVKGLKMGEVVYGYQGIATMGAFAEEIVVPASTIARAPTGFDAAQLATLPLPSLCALQAADSAGIGAGSLVLVHGGAGGVGSVAVQIFAALGARVTATASSKDAEWVTALGAHRVVDYRTERFEDVVRNQDLIFDTVGGETLLRSFVAVKPEGMVASISAMPEAQVLLQAGLKVPGPLKLLLPLMGRKPRKHAQKAKARFSAQVTVPSGARLTRATVIAEASGLQTRMDEIFAFDDLPKAIEHAASGKARGRVVVMVN
ncbi:MAG: NADP-dependent oxidoreductase [Bradymonadia bacterium]